MKPDLDSRLRHLRLSGMAATLPVRNQEAIHNNLAHVDFLDLLVEDELNRRRDRLLERRIKQAGLPQMKTLDDFEWSFNPELPKALILDLATGRFVSEHAGVLFIGPPRGRQDGLWSSLGRVDSWPLRRSPRSSLAAHLRRLVKEHRGQRTTRRAGAPLRPVRW